MPLFPSVLALALIGYFGVSYAAPAQNDARTVPPVTPTSAHCTPVPNMRTFRAQPAMTVLPTI